MVKCVCGVDAQAAITVIGILEQPMERRLEIGFALGKALDEHVRVNKGYDPNGSIGVAIKKGNLYTQQPPPIYVRVAKFVMYACACRRQEAVDLLIRRLHEFIGGNPRKFINAFHETEFVKPVKLRSHVNNVPSG